MDGKRLKGLPVVSIDGGLNLGTIHDSIIDIESRRIVSFGVRQGGGLLHGVVDPPLIVDAADIHALGDDALTLDSGSALREGVSGGRPNAISLNALLSRKVVTESGIAVGGIVNAVIDPADLRLASIEISPGLLRSNKTIEERYITSLGGDVVIVSDTIASEES